MVSWSICFLTTLWLTSDLYMNIVIRIMFDGSAVRGVDQHVRDSQRVSSRHSRPHPVAVQPHYTR